MAKQRQKDRTEDRATRLLEEADLALTSMVLPATAPTPRQVNSFHWEEFSRSSQRSIRLDDGTNPNAEVELRLELGRTRLHPDEVNLLRSGSVISLDESANEPVSVYAGGRLVARGDVLVLDGKIGVRICEIVGT